MAGVPVSGDYCFLDRRGKFIRNFAEISTMHRCLRFLASRQVGTFCCIQLSCTRVFREGFRYQGVGFSCLSYVCLEMILWFCVFEGSLC